MQNCQFLYVSPIVKLCVIRYQFVARVKVAMVLKLLICHVLAERGDKSLVKLYLTNYKIQIRISDFRINFEALTCVSIPESLVALLILFCCLI